MINYLSLKDILLCVIILSSSLSFLWILPRIFYEIFRSRPDMLPESYPFQRMFQMLSHIDSLNDYFVQLFQEFKTRKTWSLKILGMEWWLYTNDLENITYILKNLDIYGKGPLFKEHFEEMLGDGIFRADGDLWFKHRKTSSHLFNLNIFKHSVLDTFNEHGEEMVAKIATFNGKPFDIQDILFRFTLDSIGQIAFGTSFSSQKQDKILFAEAFDYIQYVTNLSFFDPLWKLKRMFAPSGREYYRCLKLVDEIAYSVVKQRKKEFREENLRTKNNFEQRVKEMDERDEEEMKRRKGKGSDIISLYMQRHDEEKEGELSDKVLRDVVINFMIAGRDTTANALTWAIYRLCLHPEIQQLVYEEVRDVFQKKGLSPPSIPHSEHTDFRISYECLHEMKYLEAFVMEVLRLHPSIPKELKQVLKKDTLPDGTEVLPGMRISFHPYCMGRSPEFWGPDCLEFKPERFLGVPKPSPFVFSAFQAGPRICLGQNLAMLELKYGLARLLSSYRFQLEQDPSSVTYVMTISLPVRDGLMVSAHPREKIYNSPP